MVIFKWKKGKFKEIKGQVTSWFTTKENQEAEEKDTGKRMTNLTSKNAIDSGTGRKNKILKRHIDLKGSANNCQPVDKCPVNKSPPTRSLQLDKSGSKITTTAGKTSHAGLWGAKPHPRTGRDRHVISNAHFQG